MTQPPQWPESATPPTEPSSGGAEPPSPPPFPAQPPPAPLPAPPPFPAQPPPAPLPTQPPAPDPFRPLPPPDPTQPLPAPDQPLYPGTSYGAPPPYGYGYGYPQPYQAPPQTNGMAIAAMVVSIVGALGLCAYGVGGFIGLVGAILGHVARRQIRTRNEGGEGMALAGIIVGWIATGLAVIAAAFVVWFFVWMSIGEF